MLVLSRKIGEVITVGSSVKVTVLSYDRGVVRLGIEAPKTIPIHRKEVHDKIVEMNKKAALTKVSELKDALSRSAVIFDKTKVNNSTKKEVVKYNQVMDNLPIESEEVKINNKATRNPSSIKTTNNTVNDSTASVIGVSQNRMNKKKLSTKDGGNTENYNSKGQQSTKPQKTNK